MEINTILARGSTLSESSEALISQEEKDERESQRAYSGATKLKRLALGLCGSKALKTLDEMGELLYSANMATSAEEGRSLVPHLLGQFIRYSPFGNMKISEVQNPNGEKNYKIEARIPAFDPEFQE